MAQSSQQPKKIEPIEVFQVLGASDVIEPATLKQTSKEVGASPEVVEFMAKLPEDVQEPADVVAAAADAGNNPAGIELDLPQPSEPNPELTIEEITQGPDQK